LENAFSQVVEKGGYLSVIIFDIDFFKSINDTYGHDVGDIVLVKISEILNGQFRSRDIFARYGGEEFLAVLPGTQSKDAEKIAWRACNAVAAGKVVLKGGREIQVTVSGGVGGYEAGDQNYGEVVKRSDMALYLAKSTGRNRICLGTGSTAPPETVPETGPVDSHSAGTNLPPEE
jgi:diguanylate cyclase (GGDEF)-like protein